MTDEPPNRLTAFGKRTRTVVLTIIPKTVHNGIDLEVHNGLGDLPMPGDAISEDQLVELESYISSGLFLGRNSGVAVQIAAACRLDAARLGNGHRPDMRFIRRLESIADKLERAARGGA